MEREVLMKSAEQVGEVVQGMAEGSRKRMGREYASAYEAWAVLADGLERAKSDMKALEKLHTDLWKATREGQRGRGAHRAAAGRFERDAAQRTARRPRSRGAAGRRGALKADLSQRAAVTAGSCGAPKQGKKKAARGSGRWSAIRA